MTEGFWRSRWMMNLSIFLVMEWAKIQQVIPQTEKERLMAKKITDRQFAAVITLDAVKLLRPAFSK